VMNRQREEIYRLRRDILEGKEGREYLLGTARDILDASIDAHCPEKEDPRDWNLTDLATDFLGLFDVNLHTAGVQLEGKGVEELRETLWNVAQGKYDAKLERYTPELIALGEKQVMLRVVDHSWKDHLLALDHLKEGINLRGYGQRDPLNEYKRESYELFEEMRNRVEDTITRTAFRMEPVSPEEMIERERQRRESARSALRFSAASGGPDRPQTVTREGDKVGRNDPCPCGSGKKYKKCHGAHAAAAT
jgi:preprotein translocase subunit SecA